MFYFTKDDTPLTLQTKGKQAQFRLLGFRHNPYVGTFHRINYIPFSSESLAQDILSESRKNPLVGMIRHSPSTLRKSAGLKSVIEEDVLKSPLLSRINFVRFPGSTHGASNFVASLKEIPHSVYSVSSSHENDSVMEAEVGAPCCAICMEQYHNGDEILTLNCSHCYHSECVSKWFYQDCLDSADMTSSFKCPKCRKNHTEALDSSTVGDEGISSLSLLQLGRHLIEEGGYDFLNDLVRSEVSSIKEGSNGKHQKLPTSLIMSSMLGSNYCDCGYPRKEPK